MDALMVTGHRALDHPTQVAAQLRHVLAKAAPAVAVSGGAAGADSLFAAVAIECEVPLELYLPNRFYRAQYPQAVSDELVAAARAVHVVVDRPDVADWRDRWRAERWWTDNFARNAAMVAASSDAVVVSPRHPRVLLNEPKGGTAACLRDLRRARPDSRVIWVPDRPDGVPLRCAL